MSVTIARRVSECDRLFFDIPTGAEKVAIDVVAGIELEAPRVLAALLDVAFHLSASPSLSR